MLIISLIPLFAAPFLHWLCTKRAYLVHLMDGFIFVAIGGLIVSGILPEVVHNGGWWALLFVVLGLAVPTLSERLFHSVKKVHVVALVFGLIGLFLHAITDGAALHHGDHGDHAEELLSLGVLLHRIPIGLTIWWFVKPQFGKVMAFLVLFLIAIGTVVGYSQASAVLLPLSSTGIAYFQAFVVGSLIHIVFHRPHTHDSHCSHTHTNNWAEGVGNLIGGGVVIYVASHHNHFVDMAWFEEMSHTLYDLVLESAPALLLAYLLAGLVAAFLPQSYVHWLRGGRAWKQSMRGVLVGLPLPVCSCGVVPLYHTLIRKGAPPAAAMAFLIATPELGIDAILISLPLLGETMTLVRIIAAGLVALLVGIIVGRIAPILSKTISNPEQEQAERQRPWIERLRLGLAHGLGELVDHTGPWILIGLLVAAAMQPVLGTGFLDMIPDFWEIPLFALLGMPLYVCASGATPMIAVFLMNGVSPGAAIAFLITGPATNVTTFGILSQLHGRKTAIFFGAVTFIITIMLALAVNLALPQFQPKVIDEAHGHGNPLQVASLILLGLLFGFSLVRRGARAFLGELLSQGGHAAVDHDDHGNHHHHHDHHHERVPG